MISDTAPDSNDPLQRELPGDPLSETGASEVYAINPRTGQIIKGDEPMSKRAIKAIIIIEANDDAPLPHSGDLLNLLMHRNFEVTDAATTEDGGPIITIRQVAKV